MSLISQYEGRSLSTRLSDDNLRYFLKYAQEHKTASISDTFNYMVEQMRKHENLDNVELNKLEFEREVKRAGKKKETLTPFLKKKGETITVEEPPEPEPEPEEDNEPEPEPEPEKDSRFRL